MSQYFPKLYEAFNRDINVKVDLPNYTIKADIKTISQVDTSSLANLKTEVDKLDIDKLKPFPDNVSKLSNVVTNEVVKKTEYNKLVAKVNNIDTSRFVLKAKYDTDKSELENKIPDTSGLVKKTDYNIKITEIESKIPDISNLATKTALTTIENKIPNFSNLVKKIDYGTKVTEIENKLNNHNHDKYHDTQEFNTLAGNVFNSRLAQANLVTKTDFDAKLSSLNRKVTKNKTDHLLVQNEFKKLKIFYSGCFIGTSHFEEDSVQNYLVFQPLNKYFKVITRADTKYVSLWQSKGPSDETIKAPATSNNSLNPKVGYYGTKTRLEFRGSCLKQDKSTFNHGKIVNIYIVYELDKIHLKRHPTLVNCLLGAVSITKNADIDKNKYSGYGIGFDRTGLYLLASGRFGRNVITFGIDMSSSVRIDNKGTDILILGKGPTQGLGEHSLTAEKMCSVNFTDNGDKFCLSLHYDGANNYFFVNGVEIIKLKAKDSSVITNPLCLGNISKDWPVDNMKDTGLNGYFYDFSVDYDATSVDDIEDIHKYLMKKNDVV